MNAKYPIILTGTINPNKFSQPNSKSVNVTLSDTKIRLEQYENAIKSYIRTSIFTDIIFVENSGYKFDAEKFSDYAKKYDKHFEYLPMMLSDEQIKMMAIKGKSYGEALLIDYAIKNSILALNSQEIWKVTGRIFLNNSKKIVKHRHKGVWESICDNPRKIIKYRHGFTGEWLHTEFVKIIRNDYQLFLSDSWNQCDDYLPRAQGAIERIWYKLLKQNHVKVCNFYVYPDLRGICASQNRPYDTPTAKLLLKSILCKFGNYSLH